MARLEGKNILIIIPKDYYVEEELEFPLKKFREEGADVRIASASELYERAPLSAYLTHVSRRILPAQRSALKILLHPAPRRRRQFKLRSRRPQQVAAVFRGWPLLVLRKPLAWPR